MNVIYMKNNDEHLTLLIVMKDEHTKQTQDKVINMLQTQKNNIQVFKYYDVR